MRSNRGGGSADVKYSASGRGVNAIAEAEEEEEFDSDYEFPDDLIADMMDHGAGASTTSRQHGDKGSARTRRANDKAVAPLSAERRAVMESQFEELLEEYADEEIGYLSEVL